MAMTKHWPLWLVAAVVAGLIGLSFLHPTAMLAPGALSVAHQPLGEDCFACHQAGHGATSERCQSCHHLADIGLRNTQHRPLPADAKRVGFHQHLAEKNCLACHQEHAGSAAALPHRKFSHALLEPHIKTRCNACHSLPQDGIHQDFKEQCSACHRQQAWLPATFDHTRWFPLSGDHAASCATCHPQTRTAAGSTVRRNFKVYTCYGCHEHSVNGIRAEHAEEGIRNLSDCVRCHRNGREHGEGSEGSEGGEND
jgi:hypothetical protein